jgi:hypothetical protein
VRRGPRRPGRCAWGLAERCPAYLWLSALDAPMDALLFSIDSMSTRGASGLTLERSWRMMGALEAVDGMLLFGMSTAYIFAVMQVHWSMLSAHVTASKS